MVTSMPFETISLAPSDLFKINIFKVETWTETSDFQFWDPAGNATKTRYLADISSCIFQYMAPNRVSF